MLGVPGLCLGYTWDMGSVAVGATPVGRLVPGFEQREVHGTGWNIGRPLWIWLVSEYTHERVGDVADEATPVGRFMDLNRERFMGSKVG